MRSKQKKKSARLKIKYLTSIIKVNRKMVLHFQSHWVVSRDWKLSKSNVLRQIFVIKIFVNLASGDLDSIFKG